MFPQNYKWTIVYDLKTRKFRVTGFVNVNNRWSEDGGYLEFNNLDDALLKIKETEPNTSRTGN